MKRVWWVHLPDGRSFQMIMMCDEEDPHYVAAQIWPGAKIS